MRICYVFFFYVKFILLFAQSKTRDIFKACWLEYFGKYKEMNKTITVTKR